MREFERRVRQRLNLSFNPAKCRLWFLDEASIEPFRASHPDCPYPISTRGMNIAGVPMGTRQYVQEQLRLKVDKVLSDLNKLYNKLRNVSRQNLYALLVYCVNTRVSHLAQCHPPRTIRRQFRRFDKAVTKVAAACTGIPLTNETDFVTLRFRLPAKLRGGMLRRSEDVAPAAFVGGMLQALPAMIDRTDGDKVTPGIIPHMTDIFGAESFDPGMESERLAVFVSNQHILTPARDLVRNWITLRREVYGPDATAIMIPDACPFKVSVQAAGVVNDKVVGKMQHRITTVREEHRASQLDEEAEDHCAEDPIPQHIMAYRSVDRFSQQFVCAPATRTCILDNNLFAEVWSTYMGTPSPACLEWEGTEFHTKARQSRRRHQVGRYGNTITSVSMPGDHWRVRHNGLEMEIKTLADWARFPISYEVLNLFAPVIRSLRANTDDEDADEDTEREDTSTPRQIQGMVPDFLLTTSNQLADVKTMSCCPSNYPRERFRNGLRHDAVRVRQGKVQSQMRYKARRLDRTHNNHTDPTPGPVQAKLASYGRVLGLVCGAFGEGSPDLHALADGIADAAVATRFQDLGAASFKEAKARALRYAYRRLGMEMMRGTAALRYHRLNMVLSSAPSIKAAAARRKWARTEWQNEHDAYFEKFHYGSRPHHRRW